MTTSVNLDLPASTLDDAFRKLTRPEGATAEYRTKHSAQVNVIDFDKPGNNDWVTVNQFTGVSLMSL